ncbi:hypothetical protein COLO4_08160 [Corchorus olitorius]|uniref:Uncharacterized protein n=1 Tax=Corchorus olitorius TaxID=93759 RepID=A0A1R3KH18_9ROSI|nr:hypothetical protein COLO4_08160 [Corchorus olitorius]
MSQTIATASSGDSSSPVRELTPRNPTTHSMIWVCHVQHVLGNPESTKERALSGSLTKKTRRRKYHRSVLRGTCLAVGLSRKNNFKAVYSTLDGRPYSLSKSLTPN